MEQWKKSLSIIEISTVNSMMLIAVLQFPAVCLLLLVLLARTRLWAYYSLWRKVIWVFLLYLAYFASALIFLSNLELRYRPILIEYSILYLGLIVFVFLIAPLLGHYGLMLADGKFPKQKKMAQLQQFFTTADSVILLLLAQPVIYVQLVLGNSSKYLDNASLAVTLLFIIVLTALVVYKIINMPKIINEKRLWWIILFEWLFIVGLYIFST